MSDEQIVLMSQLDDCLVVFSDDSAFKVIDGEVTEARFSDQNEEL
jgi:hypothetical protein